MSQPADSDSADHLGLPRRWAIEVDRFDLGPPPRRPLHICPECGSPLVQPLRWHEGPGGWALTLRCPNCDWMIEGLFAADQVDRLEEQVDAGLVEMLSDLRRLARANQAEEIDRFAAALQTELILPEDF